MISENDECCDETSRGWHDRQRLVPLNLADRAGLSEEMIFELIPQ